MRIRKYGLFAAMLAAGACLLSGCGQVDDSVFESTADFSVNISVPFATTEPDEIAEEDRAQVEIDANAATETAVRRFEQTYGIMQTGIATQAFQEELFSSDAPVYGTAEYESAVVSQYTTLQRGAVGSAVYARPHRL